MPPTKRVLVVGGSDAGTMAALRARELDPDVQLTMLVADRYPNFSVCGLPFFISREVDDWGALAHRSAAEIAGQGIDVLLDHVVTRVDAAARTVSVRTSEGREGTLPYDTLVLATGARPRAAGIQGMDLPGIAARSPYGRC